MHYIEGVDRRQQQLLPGCVDDYVPGDSAVRVIEAFVDGLDLRALGFVGEEQTTGRPSYHPGVLLKLYVYGYLQRIRSSRRLEAECGRNLEVIWLLGQLRPDHWTIAAFRREHQARFKGVLREFNLLCRKLGLFGAELVAIDGAKFKAVNNRGRYYTSEQLRELVQQIDARIDRYVEQMDAADEECAQVPGQPSAAELAQQLATLQQHRAEVAQLHEQVQREQRAEVALTDRDSRGQKKVGVGYNVQVAVDAKHHLIAAENVVQDANDFQQLAPMAEAAQAAIGVSKVVADAGYHSAAQLKRCEQAQITTYVPTRCVPGNVGGIYARDQFAYDPEQNAYRCPAGQTLKWVGSGRSHGLRRDYYANRWACAQCPVRAQCTTSHYRRIGRSEDEPVVERQAQRVAAEPERILQRREIVEHVFGTLRVWGHDVFQCRGLQAVRAEFTLSALSYNLRRALNVLGADRLIAALQRA